MPNEGQHKFWNRTYMDTVWPHLEQVSDNGTPLLLAAANAQPGERILDVGCGGGKTTLALAAAVGPQGAAVGVDISEPMISLARQRLADYPGSNASFIAADAQEHKWDQTFDAVVSQFGCMFFDAPELAYGNLAQALAPEGRLACVVWQEAEKMDWMPNRLLQPLMPQAESPINPHALADPDYVQALLSQAGFTDISSQPQDVTAHVGEDFLQDAFTVDLVEPEHRDAARAIVAEHKARFRDGDLYTVTLPMLVITARKA